MHTSGHSDQGTWQVRMKRVSTGPPFKDDTGGFVDEKVQDGQVDIKLLFIFVVHSPGKNMQTLDGVSIAVVETVEGVSQFLLQVSHGRVVEGSCGQHGDEGIISGQDKAQEGLQGCEDVAASTPQCK
ncbi:hypothetical protein HBH95_102270 [Parastagonospora nodorum]|nr:hypothetical protein HBH50_162470 [Parastagonospora nodorum]KAH4084529.1 hypothetical protein HBH48_160200 [Parastagonospora nodorum]KAH5077652.1 hypothetical protein HBH95_102270 [Parastagonospora nodorum]